MASGKPKSTHEKTGETGTRLYPGEVTRARIKADRGNAPERQSQQAAKPANPVPQRNQTQGAPANYSAASPHSSLLELDDDALPARSTTASFDQQSVLQLESPSGKAQPGGHGNGLAVPVIRSRQTPPAPPPKGYFSTSYAQTAGDEAASATPEARAEAMHRADLAAAQALRRVSGVASNKGIGHLAGRQHPRDVTTGFDDGGEAMEQPGVNGQELHGSSEMHEQAAWQAVADPIAPDTAHQSALIAAPAPSLRPYGADRRATAKLDYYRKLAELQEMNLEFGRSIREAKQQQAQPKPVAPLRPDQLHLEPARAEVAPAQQSLSQQHPLTNAFHVASRRMEPRRGTLPLPKAHSLPPVQRVTAQLDFNRVVEFQRQLDEAQAQQQHAGGQRVSPSLPPAPPPPPQIRAAETAAKSLPQRNTAEPVRAQRNLDYAEPPSIEDRLSARVVESMRPRLPVRVWETNPEQALQPVRPTPRPHPDEPLGDFAGQTVLVPRKQRAQPAQALEVRPTPRPATAPTRVREVLLDPTRIDPHLIALSDLNPRAAKYYDQVAVSLISISYKRLCKRVLVASAQHGEGRTCVTLNLAAALARSRQRVLVVDCDLVNPSVLRLLGIDAPIGLSEAVRRGMTPQSAALRVQPAAFNILPLREKIQHSAELLASDRFHGMLQLCEPDYDFILFDSAPLLESADANLLAGLTDATLMVIRPGLTSTQQMAKAVALFNEKDICGVVLNRVQG